MTAVPCTRAAAVAGGRRRRVRRRRHLRRGAGAARHDGRRRASPIDELQRAAPIVSGFLLGYVAMLPLIGRIADLRGRVPVLVASLVVFALGLAGHRAGLRPADAWSPAGSSRASAAAGWCRRRWRWSPTSTPPSAAASRWASSPRCRRSAACSARCSAPLVLAVADWRAIFSINLAVGLVLAAAIRTRRSAGSRRLAHRAPRSSARAPTGSTGRPPRVAARHRSSPAAGLPAAGQPDARPHAGGSSFIPFAGDGRWLTPIGA